MTLRQGSLAHDTCMALAAALLLSGPVFADEQSAAAPGQLPQIDVHARRALERNLDDYILKVTRASIAANDRPMVVWKKPICPLVSGLPHAVGQALFDHFTDVIDSLGRPRGRQGCKPNFLIVAVSQPEPQLRAWWHQHPNAFSSNLEDPEKFLRSTDPVRVWYNSRQVDLDGIQALSRTTVVNAPLNGPFDEVPTFQVHDNGQSLRATFSVVPDLMNVLVIIDVAKVDGVAIAPLAEYIAMAGLTNVNLDAPYGDAPTILRLFSESAGEKPQGLSDWDRSFLDTLYKTEQSSRHQRGAVLKGMVATLAR